MWALPQEVTFETAEDLKQVGLECIAQAEGDLQLDVGGVQQANSIAVALLCAWHRHASLQHKSIVFVNLSQELRNIIALSGLDDVIAVGPNV